MHMVITVGYSYWEFEDHKDPVLEVMDLVDWAVPIGAGLAFLAERLRAVGRNQRLVRQVQVRWQKNQRRPE
jgi:hypothetical protein